MKEATSGKSSSESIRIDQMADPADVTRELADRDVAVQILDRESALVRRLRAALERIRDGSYGLCMECEDTIAPKRLKAIPWAERCIHCQEAFDLGTSSNHAMDFEYRPQAA